MDIQTQDGILLKGVPDGTPDDVIKARIQSIRAGKEVKAEQPEMPATVEIAGRKFNLPLASSIAGNPLTRFAIGAAEPILGAGQLVVNTVSDGKGVNSHLSQLEGLIEQGRGKDAGSFDPYRFAGNVASPVNAAMAKAVPAAATTAKRIGTGMLAGAVGAATTPVTTEGDYWSNKAIQTGVGVLGGGVATPILGKLTDAIAPRIAALAAKFSTGQAEKLGARASLETDRAIEQALKEIGAKAEDMGAEQMTALRQQVLSALKKGKMQDPAALLREQDFKAVGVDPTLGQLTRDATQFARERNLRGVPGVGDPLQVRFDKQNQQLQEKIGALRGSPSEAYPAGVKIADALKAFDANLKSTVDQAYKGARDNVGRAVPVDHVSFSKAANLALDENMLGHYLPAEVKGILNDVTTQKIPLNVNTMVQIDSVLSGAQRAAGKGTPQALAIGKVRDALNQSPIENQAGEMAKEAFDKARTLAAQRFGMHEAIPALEAAASGEAPDKFVQQFVLNGKVDQVKKLADLLKSQSPEAYQEARAQLGAKITRAAFGENTAGDKLAAPERLATVLREIGTDKLRAFYSPDEIAQFKTLSRVAAYINSTPGSAAVNTSNNIGAITGLATKIPGTGMVSTAASLANALRNIAGNASTVNKGVAAQIPVTTAKPSPEQARQLAKLLTASGFGAGVAGASAVR